jgi:hypothetical protein
MCAAVDEILGRLGESLQAAAVSHARGEAERSGAFARENARRELTEALNTFVRQLKQAESREVWARTLLDATEGFCAAAALFEVEDVTLRFEGARGIAGEHHAEAPLSSAPAFAGAVASGDTVVAAATPRELSPAIASIVAPEPSARAYLFPVAEGSVTVAVLFASPEENGAIDVSALELLTALAGSWMPGTRVEEPEESEPAAQFVTIAPAAKPAIAPRPSWTELSTSERELHLKAQRYARTRVAAILLRAGDRVRGGRTAGNLYSSLKEEIESGREDFRKQFVEPCTSMVDYFHLELAGTLAKGDAALLGPGYPGPLQ